MVDVLIFGAYSNICRKKVLKSIESIHGNISKINVYDRIDTNTEQYSEYLVTKCGITNATFIKKVHYHYGNFDSKSYEETVLPLITNESVIYLGIPPFCYTDILSFLGSINHKVKVILEKPLGCSFDEFIKINDSIESSNHKVALCDHYIYKCQRLIKEIKRNNLNMKYIDITLHYSHGVGTRTGYFDKTGLFVDIFQGHILWILFELLGAFTIEDISQLQIDKKQYANYEGNNPDTDTFFFLCCKIRNTIVRVSCGKKMPLNMKTLRVDDKKHIIEDGDEYSKMFDDVIKNKLNTLEKNFRHQSDFWKITNFLIDYERFTKETDVMRKYCFRQ